MASLGVVSGASGVFWNLELGFSLTMESGRKKNWLLLACQEFPLQPCAKDEATFLQFACVVVVSAAAGVFWSLELGFSLTVESGRKNNWHVRNFPYSRAQKMKRLFCK